MSNIIIKNLTILESVASLAKIEGCVQFTFLKTGISMDEVKIYHDKDSFEALFEEQAIRKFKVNEQKLLIAKTKEGFFAFEALCPHQKHPLKQGQLHPNGQAIICGLHGYQFHLKNGKEQNSKCQDLKTYQVGFQPDGVYLNLY